jgi:beta-lactamase class A
MIAYSDNNATFLLLKNINLEMYNKTYTDIGLPKPSFKFEEFTLTAKQYSLFLKELYNASYLSIPASEYAVNLLTQCDFKEGLVKKLPPNTIVAHKFGENGYGSIYELHESGIVYIGDNAYLITIMTKGTDSKYLCNVVADISYAVFSKITFD